MMSTTLKSFGLGRWNLYATRSSSWAPPTFSIRQVRSAHHSFNGIFLAALLPLLILSYCIETDRRLSVLQVFYSVPLLYQTTTFKGTLRSSSKPLLCKPTTRTHFADRAFRCSAPAVWNSLLADIVVVHLSLLSELY